MLEFLRGLALAIDSVLVQCKDRIRYNPKVLAFMMQQIEKVVNVVKSADALSSHERTLECVNGLEAALLHGKLLMEEHKKPFDSAHFHKTSDLVDEVQGICRALKESLDGLRLGQDARIDLQVRDELVTEDKLYMEWYLRCLLEGRSGGQKVNSSVLRHLEMLKMGNIQHLERMLLINESALTLGRSIGQGHMGEVFQARWAGRTVAVKKLRLTPGKLTTEGLAKFLTSVEMNVLVKHPHVLECYAATKSGCLVMELAQKNLQQLCLEARQLGWDTKIDLLMQAAQGLAYLHSRGMVHQNVKSRNFLVLGGHPGSSTIKVADYGMANWRAAIVESSPGQLLGSDPWIAPDLTAGRPPDFASDIFGFGVVMYEVASQSLPYGKMRSDQMLGRKQDWSDPCCELHKCPEPLKEVMKGCINPDPEERPTMKAVCTSLQSIRTMVGASSSLGPATHEFLKTSVSVPDACMDRGSPRTVSCMDSDLLNSAYSVPEGIDAEELANQLATFEIDFALEKATSGRPSYFPEAHKTVSNVLRRPIMTEIHGATSNQTSGSSASLTVTLTGTSLLTLDHSVSPKVEVSSFTRQWVKSRGIELKHTHDDDKGGKYSTTEEESQKSRYTASYLTSGTDEGNRKLMHGTAFDTNLQAVSQWVADSGSRQSMEERAAMLHGTAYDDSLRSSKVHTGQRSGWCRPTCATLSDAAGASSRAGRGSHSSLEARRNMLHSTAYEGNLKASRSRCGHRDEHCGVSEVKRPMHNRDLSSRTGDSHATPYEAYDELGEGPSTCAWQRRTQDVDTVSTIFSLTGSNLAAKKEKLDSQYTVKWILDQEMQLSRRSSDRTLLHNAAISGNVELTEALVAGVVNINKIDKYGRTALHDAAQWGRTAVAELLLQNSANSSIQDIGGETPLHLAACGSSISIVKLLLAHMRDRKDMRNNYGNTALHVASMRGNLEVLRVLLEHGSDPMIRNNNRKRPQDLGDAFVKEVFRSHYSEHAPPKKVNPKRGIKQLFLRSNATKA